MAQSDLVVHIGGDASDFTQNIEAAQKSITELGQKASDELADISAQFKKSADSPAPLMRKLKDIRKQMETLATSTQGQTAEGKKLYDEMSRKAKEFDSQLRQIQNDTRATAEPTQTLAGKVAEIKRQMEALAMSEKMATVEGKKQWDELAKKAAGYNDTINKINKETKSVPATGGGIDLKSAISGIADKAGLGGVASGLGNISALLNPTTAGVVALGGAVIGAGKAFYDYNKELDRSLERTAQFTGLSGNELNSLRNGIKSVADTFGKDYDTVLSAVDGMMAQFGMDGETALNIIRDGFVSGADDGGRMLDLIGQYSGSFKDAGISASELVAIIGNTRSGIFNEEGMALIQKAGQNIRLMSDTTKQALDSIGISSDEMTKKLADGSLSTVNAMKQISSKLKELNPQSQEVGEVLKTVFGKQGAAAGMELVTALADVEDNLEIVKQQSGEWGEAMEKVQEADRNLENALQAMFGVANGGWAEMSTIIKGEIYQALADVINYFIELYNQSTYFRGSIALISTVFKTAWDIVKAILQQFAQGIKSLAEMIEGVFTLDFSKIAHGWESGMKSLFQKVKTVAQNAADNVKEGIDQTVNGKIDTVQTVQGGGEKPINNSGKKSGGGKSNKSGKKSGGGKSGGSKTSSTTTKTEKIDYLVSIDDNTLDTAEKKLQAWTSKKKSLNIDDTEEIAKCDEEIQKWTKEVEARKIALGIDVKTPPEIVEGSINDLKAKIKAKEDEIALALNTNISPEAMQKLQEELRKLRKEEEAKEIELGIKANIATISKKNDFFQRGSVEDKQQSLSNAQSMMQEIQQNYKLKFINKDEAQNQINEINNALKELGLKEIDIHFNTDGSLTTAAEDLEKYKDKMDSVSSIAGSVSNVFGSLGSAIGGTTGEIMNFAGQSIAAIGQIIPQIVSLISAKQAEAMASGAAEGAKLPFPANLAAIAGIIATLVGVFASLPKFATGGIVGGSSFTGDRLLARVNSGEMILNKNQQRSLYSSLASAEVGSPIQNTLRGDVNFTISGSALKGTLRNYDSKMSKIK